MRTSSILILLHALFATSTAARGKMTNLRELRKGDEKDKNKKDNDKKDKDKDKDKNKDKGKDKDEGILKGRFEDRLDGFNPYETITGNSLKEVKPSEVGTLHNVAFDMLAQSIDPSATSVNAMQLMMEVNNIMGQFCDDAICESMASKATVRSFQQEQTESGVLQFPDSMDKKVEAHLRLTQTVIKSMDGSNTEEALNMLHAIEKDLTDMEDVTPEYQNAAIASVSVARESTQLWIKVFEDETHPLHKMVTKPKPVSHDDRRLQIDAEISNAAVNVTVEVNYDVIIDNVQESVVAAVTAALSAVDSVVNLVNVVITNMVNLTVETIATTVEAVRAAVLGVVDSAIQVVVTVKNLGVAVAQGAVAVANQAVDTTVAVANATVQAGITVATTVATVAVETVETGIDATVALANATYQAADAVVDATVDVALAVGGAAVELAIDVAEGVVDTVQNVAETVVDTVQDVVQDIKALFENISRIIDADFVGASNGSAAMVNLMFENPTYLFPLNWLPMSVVVAFWYSFPASAAAALRFALQ